MGATQWEAQIANLSYDRFIGARGSELHSITVQYEIEVMPGIAPAAEKVVRRLVAGDLARWRAGHLPTVKTFHTLLKTSASRSVTRMAGFSGMGRTAAQTKCRVGRTHRTVGEAFTAKGIVEGTPTIRR
jgi:hypothetical protein